MTPTLVSSHPTVVAVIPARNETNVIGRPLLSLLHQGCSAQLHAFVFDDNNTDGTVDVARQAVRARNPARSP